MSNTETVAKLEALLQRVQARAHVARGVSAAMAAPAPAPGATPAHSAAPVAAPTAPPQPRPTPFAVQAQPLISPAARPTPVPASGRHVSSIPPATVDDEEVLDVSPDDVEVDVDVEESAPGRATSETHIIAAGTAPKPEDTEDEIEDVAASPPRGLEVAAASSPDIEVQEGRRYEVPRHTPPPESGRQVATSSQPEGRESQPPLPNMGTGWREPGLGDEAGARSGRRASSAPSIAASEPPASSRTMPPMASASEVVAPALSGSVASYAGTAPVFAPATFGELLDATLGL